jgi:ABC-type uncharacterized transport system auxiliary subunit
MRRTIIRAVGLCMAIFACILCSQCLFGTVPVKQYYVLNYVPVQPPNRLRSAPYPYTVRIKELDIEDAYSRPSIVYRQSPFELRYYFYRLWAVKPSRMITDLIYKHLSTINFVSGLVRRFDEGAKPDYELSGLVEAVEEYDSDQLWFAHISVRLTLTRVSDAAVVYSKLFDNRKRVFNYSPDNVVKEMSAVIEFIMDQAVQDLDSVFSKENAGPPGSASAPVPAVPDSEKTSNVRKTHGAGGE